MTIMKTTLSTVSALALLTGAALADETRSGDMDGSDDSAAQVAQEAPSTAETTGKRNSEYATMEAIEGKKVRADYDDQFVNNMSELSTLLLEENVDYAGSYVGKPVRSKDGKPVGTVTGVYGRKDGRTTIIVEANDDFDYDQHLFAVSLPSEMESDDHFEIPVDRTQLNAELGAAFGETPR